MVRILILIGFSFIFMHLHATGTINKYINMKYSYISFSTIFIFILLTIAQVYFYVKDGDKKNHDDHDHEHDHSCSCGHDHSHDEDKWYKKLIVYPIMIFPLVAVMCFPIATLDSKMVEAKGFHFPILEGDDASSNHQILQPDTSTYYGAEDYDKLMDKSKKQYEKKNSIILNDDNYLKGMETIYNFPGEFTGKTVSLTGFSYNSDDLKKNEVFLFRFGIIHCVADSGVYGMLIQFPDDMDLENDEWLRVSGELDTMYYQPFKKTIPVLKVKKYEKISEPEDTYVYRQY
ncbi:TIGR03943 family putative permease subunit [Priestia filamentosa]|uniref:TIGR03943 family putative permease subunit n=1 Tax=Priestia filamentosa TaxID=1402861 RepID=UPI000A0828CF|nr:TIGR03943 family protein [Priestia filamentosa]MDT3763582.1 TIGR03943 family protein [Priestia filamentosa]OXS71921.1 TIGR03943 family protein [Priestia filamentosa]WRU94014.1 TIGR03943 family protein [Priestia filamentosa]SMF15796.1 putative membrane protein [Priestia filamentosa]